VRSHALALTIAVLGVPAAAHADVDWARGYVTATGLGIADRHAPTPAAAREPARRAAEEAAKRQLAAAAATLPLAGGGTLKAKLADPKIKARVDEAIANARPLASTPQTDGSWDVTLGLPIEAIRIAVSGPRTFAATDSDPPIVIVENVTTKPAVGTTVGGTAAAALWVREVPDWASSAPRIKATGGKAGAIEVAKKQGGPSTLYILLAK
jgi:hypothetical protein